MTSLLLVGMGLADQDLASLFPGTEVAHLQLWDPSLSAALTRLADAGASPIVVVGFASGSAPGISWVRRNSS